MNDYYKDLLQNKEHTKNFFRWITDDQFDYIKQNFHDLECDLSAFISYSNKDKKIAGIVKKALSNLGIDSFLAHEDITPSQEWQDEIVNKINNCNIFVPLISDNFRESDWASQEIGAAFIKGVDIIPISFYSADQTFVTPYGFISKYQTLRWKIDPGIPSNYQYKIVLDIQNKIAQALKSKNNIVEKVRNCLVNSFVNSSSFQDTNNKSESIDNLNPLGKERLTILILGYILNNQIKNAFKASDLVIKLIKDNKEELDDILISIFEKSNL